MFRRSLLGLARARPSLSVPTTTVTVSVRAMASQPQAPQQEPASLTPVEDAIREKLTAALQPTTLEIHNDSHLHAHHKAMQGVTSRETHFRLVITSEAFASHARQPARHRLVYSLLKDELAREGGIHALQLRTMTPEEEEQRKAKEAEE